MSSTTVYVKNIAGTTDDKEIRDFFSFCGKITSLDVQVEEKTKSATLTFGKLCHLPTRYAHPQNRGRCSQY